MGNIGKTMRTYVLSDSGVSAIVGTRCYPLAFPANPTFPLLVYRTIAGAYGPMSAPNPSSPYITTRMQWDVWAETYAEAQALSAELVDTFNRYSGTVSSQEIIDTRIDLMFDLFEDDTKLYRVTIDTSVSHIGA